MSGKLGRSIAALVLCALNVAAQAQSWPSKPVRIIVPFTPGSGTDIIARTVSEKLSPQLGQQTFKPGVREWKAIGIGIAFPWNIRQGTCRHRNITFIQRQFKS